MGPNAHAFVLIVGVPVQFAVQRMPSSGKRPSASERRAATRRARLVADISRRLTGAACLLRIVSPVLLGQLLKRPVHTTFVLFWCSFCMRQKLTHASDRSITAGRLFSAMVWFCKQTRASPCTQQQHPKAFSRCCSCYASRC